MPYLFQETKEKMNVDELCELVYPVGSIYMSVNDVSPATLFGGTWERIQDRFLLAASETYAAGATGGEASHKLTIEEMPAHTHNMNKALYSEYSRGNWQGVHTNNWDTSNFNPTRSTGGGKAHNNMPPYLAVYVWKRTE